MRRSSSLRLAAISLLGGTALVAAPAIAAAPAAAGPHSSAAMARPASAQDSRSSATQAERLTREFGSEAAGAYLSDGRLVVNVTNDDAVRQVRAAGASPRTVDDSMARLRQIKADLDRAGGATGMSWGVDVRTNSVVVSVPRGQDDASTEAFVRNARSHGDAVRIERVAGPVEPMALGPGDAIHTDGARCSAAVIATRGSAEYVITAGHCTDAGDQWTTSSGQLIGNTAASSFPGNDYGLIRVSDSPALAASNGSISQTGQPPVGSQVCKKGSTTGTTCGVIRGYNRTVQYPEGTVSGLIETDVCVQPGDSGGALYQSSTGIGMVSGGTVGGCGENFRSFFQPLNEPMNAYGLSLK